MELLSEKLSRRSKSVKYEATYEEIDSVDNLIEQDSPYPEVRAAVPPTDDPTLPQNTLRVWVLGTLLVTVANGANVIVSMHNPATGLSAYIVTIAVWPLGVLWYHIVPNKKVFGIELNPGPFNIKEHAIITIMAVSAFGSGTSYALDVVMTLISYYKFKVSKVFQILLVISTQACGLAMAGFVRRILIYPAAMIWPSNLVNVTLLTNIHIKANHVANGWRISRLRLFTIVVIFTTIYQWVPSFLMQFTSYMNFAAWIAPNNAVTNQLFGTVSGMALIPISFDWNQISSYFGSPLVPPVGTFVNMAIVLVFVLWIMIPIVQLLNGWYGHYLPIQSGIVYDRFQNNYNIQRVIKDGRLDTDAYKAYSPLFMSTTMAISYGMGFATITATVMHVLLFDLKDIITYWNTSRDNIGDVHMRLMRKYREVPAWAYGILMLTCVVMLIILTKLYTDLSVGSLFLALALSMVLLVPSAFITAMTNISIGLNVLAEFIIGYLQPGKPIPMILFKTVTYYTNFTAVLYLENMKFAHYLKLAPRVVFAAQLIGAVWAGITQIFVFWWAVDNIEDLCKPTQRLGYTCPYTQVFYSASAIWGVIGPQRLFQIYRPIVWFFLVGAFLPVFSWIWLKRWPRSLMRYIHWPVLFSAAGQIPPATSFNFGLFVIVGLTFAYWIRRNWFNWWAKYNYTLASALDMGVVLGQLLIFSVSTGRNISAPKWWGNTKVFQNIDGTSAPAVVLGAGESFGPSSW